MSRMRRECARKICHFRQCPQRRHSPLIHLDALHALSSCHGRRPIRHIIKHLIAHPFLIGDDPIVVPQASLAGIKLGLDGGLFGTVFGVGLGFFGEFFVVASFAADTYNVAHVAEDVAVVAASSSESQVIIIVTDALIIPKVIHLIHRFQECLRIGPLGEIVHFQIVRGNKPLGIVRFSRHGLVIVQGVDGPVSREGIGMSRDAEASSGGDGWCRWKRSGGCERGQEPRPVRSVAMAHTAFAIIAFRWIPCQGGCGQ
mmetsp:Transcript_44648/g.93706  ORF Transcript_44648/g.93706 Transcript_44648/m.93706 type:complete len:257 (+) Transcript_44648:1864-2634(+)